MSAGCAMKFTTIAKRNTCIASMYHEGLTTGGIALYYGMKQSTVLKILNDRGIKTSLRGAYRERVKALETKLALREQEILTMRMELWNMKQEKLRPAMKPSPYFAKPVAEQANATTVMWKDSYPVASAWATPGA